MNVPPAASARPPEETASAESDLTGSQAGPDASHGGHERISKPRRRRIRRSVVAVLVALSDPGDKVGLPSRIGET